MQRTAHSVGQPGNSASTTAQAGAEAGGLSSLLGAGQFLEAVIEQIPAVVFVKDASDFRFILLNRAGEEFLGVSRQAIIGRTDHDVFPKDEANRFVARDREVLKSRQVGIIEEEPVHTPHNGLRFLRTRMIVVCDDNRQPQYLLGISEDVTDQKLKAERIRHMAHHDGLTDLVNRALFRQRLDAAMAEYRSTRRGVALFFIDLDGFGSTTRSATPLATRCCVIWPSAYADARMTMTPWRGSAAMSLPFFIPSIPPARARPLWRTSSSIPWQGPSTWAEAS